MSESPPETNGTNRRDEEKSQKEIINFNFEKKNYYQVFYFLPLLWHACRWKVWIRGDSMRQNGFELNGDGPWIMNHVSKIKRVWPGLSWFGEIRPKLDRKY